MTTFTSQPQNLILKKAFAYFVHLLTASGAVWGFLAIVALFNQQWQPAIVYMLLSMFIDGVDGFLARIAKVHVYAPNIDGELMDNILDYFNYVMVAAVFYVTVPNLLPAGFEYPVAITILLTSAYQFSQMDAKTDETEDYFFRGFPSYWSVVALYMIVMQMNPWVNLAFLVAFNILVFIPIKFLYPSRDKRWRNFTVAFSYLYGIVGVWGVTQYPSVPSWVIWVSFIYVAYYAAMSFWPRKKIN